MITIGMIRSGKTYLSHHLRKNDYWSEGEREVPGEWIGEGAHVLGLQGKITEAPFEALRVNRHPGTGKRLTPRKDANRVAFFDIQFSAPKDVSVLAMVGQDERIREAFIESVKVALGEMERYAAVRERRGLASGSEQIRLTENFVGAMFLHDASRDLDPQLHVHAVLANATWDRTRNEWLALKQNEMLRASPYLRQVMYRELATRLRALGYEPYEMTSKGFSIRGVEHLRERFCKRALQVRDLAAQFAKSKGREPTPKEFEVLVRESRQDKLAEVSTPEVRMRQRAELTETEREVLDGLVAGARLGAKRAFRSQLSARIVLDAALRHTFERTSVTREGTVLAAALELHPEFFAWRDLRAALEQHEDVLRKEGEVSLKSVRREEAATVTRVREGRNRYRALGGAGNLSEKLSPAQRSAVERLVDSRDFVTVLIGDAGTGKTTVLREVEAAHRRAGGADFVALAPTTRARDALVDSGMVSADTVQRFLASPPLQQRAQNQVVLVDEAGLLSTQQLDQLTGIVERLRGRLLLVGDTKQHYSVQRGDALRNLVRHSDMPVTRLTEVRRQRHDADRRFSRLLASGATEAAFEFADRRGMIREAADDDALFTQAAERHVADRKRGVDSLVVIPFWEEIERFNTAVRPALRQAGLIGEPEVTRQALAALTWTDEQKAHWSQYREGDQLLFVRDTRFFPPGVAATVVAVLNDGLFVRGTNGREAKITRKQRAAFDVARPQLRAVAVGDKILMRASNRAAGFSNGDIKEVFHVDVANDHIGFSDGTSLPPDFSAWTYGHALTAYRSQGSTSEESLLVLGDVATRALLRRQFYVGSTRYRGSHTIYLSNKERMLQRLLAPDPGRELATEFMLRRNLAFTEKQSARVRRGIGVSLQRAWQRTTDAIRRIRRQTNERNSA